MEKGDYVKVQKISDDMFEGRHPNGIYANHTVYGVLANDLIVGEPLLLLKVRGDSYGYFHTSYITEIVDENTIKTKNSTYKIESCDLLTRDKVLNNKSNTMNGN